MNRQKQQSSDDLWDHPRHLHDAAIFSSSHRCRSEKAHGEAADICLRLLARRCAIMRRLRMWRPYFIICGAGGAAQKPGGCRMAANAQNKY